MNGLTHAAWISVLLSFCLNAFAQGTPAATARLAADQPLPRAELEAFIDGVVSNSMQDDHIAGATVAIVQNGAVILTKGYGFATLSPLRAVDPDTTLFRIGSITKTFTWIEVMKLVEAGRIQLDDAVNQHLPESLRIPDEGFSKPIRVRDLMTHQPGFEDSAIGHLFERDPAQLRPLQKYLQEQRPHRVREPGVLSSYSNYGVALAGAMIENLTGKRWQDLIEADILTPLRLTHITGREPYAARNDLPKPMPELLSKNLAGSFKWTGITFTPQPFEHMTHVAPAGVASASATSMARYMLMLLNNGSLDGAQIFAEQAAMAFRTPMTSLPAIVGNWDAGFTDEVMPAGFRAYGHDGATLTHFSSMVLLPELRLGIFISTNTAGGGKLTNPFARHIVEHFYSTPPALLAPGADAARHSATYSGEYVNTRRNQHGLEGFLMSLLNTSVFVTPEGYVVLPGPGGLQRFVPQDGDQVLRAVDGSSAVKVEIEDGRAQRLVTMGAALERVGFWERSATMQMLALFAGLASAAIVLGFFYRSAPITHNRWQAHAVRIRAVVAMAWLACLIVLGAWVIQALGDQAYAMYQWPSPLVVASSSLALFAAFGTAVLLTLLPLVWKRSTGWGLWRRARFTYTVLVFALFTLMLAQRGGLQPWNS